MSEERKKILNMLAEGKITADEAEKLLEALSESKATAEEYAPDINFEKTNKKPKNFIIKVTPKTAGGDNVNIKIPLLLLKAGIKMSSVLPFDTKTKVNDKLKEKGLNIDINNVKYDDIAPIISALSESSIDIDEDKERVQIYCE